MGALEDSVEAAVEKLIVGVFESLAAGKGSIVLERTDRVLNQEPTVKTVGYFQGRTMVNTFLRRPGTRLFT